MRDKKGRFIRGSFRDAKNYNWSGGKVILKCRNCGKKILRYPYRVKRLTSKQSKIFCNRKCKGEWQSKYLNKENHPHWKGGRRKSKEGYTQIRLPTHHRANQNGYVLEHILVAEKKYNRKITTRNHIHHFNGIKDDNRPENLVLTINSKHDKFSYVHALQKRIRELENMLK